MDKSNLLGSKIRNNRKKLGMTQKELSQLIHISASAVSKWEMGDATPDIYMINRLAEVFNIPVSELMNEGSSVEEQNETVFKENQPIIVRPKCLRVRILVIGLLILSVIFSGLLGYRYMQQEIEFTIVDEFYDDTSKHRGYDTIYHVVVEYEGELTSEIQLEHSEIIHTQYQNWFDKVEIIKISYLEAYESRADVYNTSNHSFLLPER